MSQQEILESKWQAQLWEVHNPSSIPHCLECKPKLLWQTMSQRKCWTSTSWRRTTFEPSLLDWTRRTGPLPLLRCSVSSPQSRVPACRAHRRTPRAVTSTPACSFLCSLPNMVVVLGLALTLLVLEFPFPVQINHAPHGLGIKLQFQRKYITTNHFFSIKILILPSMLKSLTAKSNHPLDVLFTWLYFNGY